MKKVVLSAICIFMLSISAQASDRADWKEYTGRYIFSIDNSEEIMDITLQEDSTLTAFSSLGEVALTYVEKDHFEFPQYGGVIIFERDEKQQIIACKVSVAAIDLEEIKAQKR
jgi:hypothetical protein